MFILILLLVWIVLVVLITAWTVWFQGYVYTEPTTGIVWRGPAAGSAVMASLLVWVGFAFVNPGRYRPLWEFSSVEESKPFPELRIPVAGGREDVYKLRPGTRNDYRLNGLPSGKALPARPPELIATEGGEKVTFKPERDEQGKFRERTTTRFGREAKEPVRYLDEKGRVMLEGSLGQLTSFRGGWFIGNLFLNVLFLAAWFVALWTLTRFQWPHALGQAVVFWLVMLLFIVPPLLTQAENVARERAAARGAANG